MTHLRLPLLVLLAALAAPTAFAQGGRVEIGVISSVDSPLPPAGLSVQATVLFLDTRPQSATLNIRVLGQNAFQQFPASDQGNGLWTVDLPFVFPAQGVEVFASFVLDGQTITEPLENPQGNPFRVPALIAAITSDVSLPARGYRMVTVPVVLGADSGAPESLGSDSPIDVIGGTFGASGAPDLWRAFRWNAESETYRDAVRDPAAVRIRPGRGFWLITNRGGTFKVEKGISAGVSFDGDTPRAAPVIVPLQSGWNQIGNPYLFPINWSGVERSGTVEDPVAFERSVYVGGQATLTPWEGYFVYNDGPPTELRFRVRPENGARIDNRPLAERMRARAGSSASVLSLTARSGDLEDAVYLGRGATQADAPVSLRKPPAIEPGFRLSVVAEDQDWMGRFDDDVWTLALEADAAVTIRLDTFGDWPGTVIEDVDRGVALATTGDEVRVPALEGVAVRTLRVRLGGAESGSSLAPSFGTARPNPTVGRVSIPFAVSAAGPVEVDVVDVLGRLVRRVLEDDLEAGSHVAEWDGLDDSGAPTAAGLYLVRLRSDLGTATTRLTRLR